MSRQKPDAYLLTDTAGNEWATTTEPNPEEVGAYGDTCAPLYRRSPAHKEEQAVVEAAVKWRFAAVGNLAAEGRLLTAVDRLLAARKAKR